MQIWTDIDGIHNNDPRHVNYSESIPELSYEAASKLAYFGAKILHPACVIPISEAGIPLRIKNTFNPKAYGTLISGNSRRQVGAVVSVKEKEVLVKIQPNHQWTVHHFLMKLFELFQQQQIEIDMISVAHRSVALVIDAKYNCQEIERALCSYGQVSFQNDFALINIIRGQEEQPKTSLGYLFEALRSIPIRMISQKKDDCNYLLLLVESRHMIPALEALNKKVLNQHLYKRLNEVA